MLWFFYAFFAAFLACSRKKRTISASPIMPMRKMRSMFPVAGPRAEKANMNRPLRNKKGPFLLIMSQMPTRIRGITMATDRVLR